MLFANAHHHSFPSAGGPSFASKPTTPTGMGGGFPPSPQKPSPQPMGGSSWQQGAGYGWQQAQPKAQPSMPHASPQNKPNYNVSFSAMPGAQNERGKGPANVGKLFRVQQPKGWLLLMLLSCSNTLIGSQQASLANHLMIYKVQL